MAGNDRQWHSPVIGPKRASPTVWRAPVAKADDEDVSAYYDDYSQEAYIPEPAADIEPEPPARAWREPEEELPPPSNADRRMPKPYDATKAAHHKRPAPPPVSERRDRRDKGKIALYASVIAVSFILICLIGIWMMPQMAGYFWADMDNYAFVNGEALRYDADAVASYKQMKEYTARDTIFPGVFIDGVYVGDMTMDEAKAALVSSGSDVSKAFSIRVNVGNLSWTVDPSNVPAQRNLGNIIEQAYAVGRTNDKDIPEGSTPFNERVKQVVALRENPLTLTTEVTYDHDAVKEIVVDIAKRVTREPVDSQIATFDFKKREFTFTDEQLGVTIDKDKLYNDIIAMLDRWERGTVLTVEPVVTQAKVTKESLTQSFTMIAAFTTDTTRDSNRNNNIDLACRAINGTAMMPGDTFSFNEATGQRTTAKGYKSAGAIAAGQSIEEVGGGICQVSSTLFNAVARADLEITSRSPHAWPSTYVNRGEDATVNWPNLDFKFRNNKDTPIFLVLYYNNRKCSAEIYGMSLGVGITIDLESTTTKTISPPSSVKYEFNASLPVGANEETVKARTGYVVDTYKVWYQGKNEIKREKLHTSSYRAYQKTIEYNDGSQGF